MVVCVWLMCSYRDPIVEEAVGMFSAGSQSKGFQGISGEKGILSLYRRYEILHSFIGFLGPKGHDGCWSPGNRSLTGSLSATE